MINLTIQSQPDDETCGATCLHAIYAHYGLHIPLDSIIQRVERSLSGGTLAPFLGKHALEQQFNATIYVNNLDIFDPSWFTHHHVPRDDLANKLAQQLQYKKNKGLVQSSLAYQDFLKNGGHVKFQTLTTNLLKHYFDQNIPILTGLSATYLYQCKRERYTESGQSIYDDIQGTPCGHFVVLCGYDEVHRRIIIADPSRENPLSQDNYYKVSINRLINAIMLGVLTYDANLLIIQPKED